jgi:Uma2 family endonuclease
MAAGAFPPFREEDTVTPQTVQEPFVLGPESAGILMTPEEFDAIEEYDEEYRYELINGVLVVNPIPLPAETNPNEVLGYVLMFHQESHPQGNTLDATLSQQYVRTRTSRRIADRLIWTGLGRVPKIRRDVPSIAVEFVSAGRRNRERDYVAKRQEYLETGIKEYWIIDRFQRTMTVVRTTPSGPEQQVVRENELYQSPLLPGFDVPLARLLAAADRAAEMMA